MRGTTGSDVSGVAPAEARNSRGALAAQSFTQALTAGGMTFVTADSHSIMPLHETECRTDAPLGLFERVVHGDAQAVRGSYHTF
eukprot:SAG11_NODE_851_length_6875_cov_8.193034_10_plen_84_part_00